MGDVVKLRRSKSPTTEAERTTRLTMRLTVQLTPAQVTALRDAVKFRADELEVAATISALRGDDAKSRLLRRDAEELDVLCGLLSKAQRG